MERHNACLLMARHSLPARRIIRNARLGDRERPSASPAKSKRIIFRCIVPGPRGIHFYFTLPIPAIASIGNKNTTLIVYIMLHHSPIFISPRYCSTLRRRYFSPGDRARKLSASLCRILCTAARKNAGADQNPCATGSYVRPGHNAVKED